MTRSTKKFEQKPWVTIVTSTLNAADTIEHTIQSVLHQTYPLVEYIVIDGGSTDGTVEIIKRYEDRIAYWMSEPDKGMGDGYNKGIGRASGDLIGIISDDDWLEEDGVEQIVRLYNRCSGDFYIGALRYIDSEDRTFVAAPDRNYAQKIGYCMPKLNHEAAFVRDYVYEQVGLYDIDLLCTIDYDFFLRVTQAGFSGCFTDAVVANKRFGGLSDSQALVGYREVYQRAPNRFKAWVWYCYAVAKWRVRRGLQVLPGSDKMLHIVRQWKHSKS